MTVDPKVYHLAIHWLKPGIDGEKILSLAEAIQTAIDDWSNGGAGSEEDWA